MDLGCLGARINHLKETSETSPCGGAHKDLTSNGQETRGYAGPLI